MKEFTKTVVGLDVHKESVVVAVLPAWSDRVVENKRLPNTRSQVEKLVKEVVGSRGSAVFVYEAGPCGYEVQRQVSGMGEECVVVAPGLIPKRASDRVKTDRRDAEKLARLWRAGELTAVRIPTSEEEADRDLVRAREDALVDRQRQRHRLLKFLLRQGRVYGEGRHWTVAHQAWLRGQRFDLASQQRTYEAYRRAWEEGEARLTALSEQVMVLAEEARYRERVKCLRCFKAVDTLTAMTVLVETQDLRRFGQAREIMKFTGLTSAEWSSGSQVRRGGIAKTGNTHLRRVLVESAWAFRRPNVTGAEVARRREGCPIEVVALARKAQDRLHRRFHRLVARGKSHAVAAVAVARELAGFLWAMSRHFPAAA
jgi:transposase